MNYVIPNHRGWKQRQEAARSKAEAKADPAQLAKSRLYGAISRRDNVRGEVTRAEDQVRTAEDQLMAFRGVTASYEAYSTSSFKVHPKLVTSKLEAATAESLLDLAEAQLAAARARLVEAEAALVAANDRFIADTTADDAEPVETPAVALVPVAAIELPIAMPIPVVPVVKVPARVDAGVSLSDDDALAALEPAAKRSRRR